MAFLAAGTQQGHREDVPSCAVTPTDLYSTVYTADPLSFSFYLQLISSLLNLSTCEGCAAPSHKPLKLIVPAQIFTADLTPQPVPFSVCSHHIYIPSVLAQPHLALSRYEASTLLLPLPEKELLIEGCCTLSAKGSCWQRHPRAVPWAGFWQVGCPCVTSHTEVTHTSPLCAYILGKH